MTTSKLGTKTKLGYDENLRKATKTKPTVALCYYLMYNFPFLSFD